MRENEIEGPAPRPAHVEPRPMTSGISIHLLPSAVSAAHPTPPGDDCKRAVSADPLPRVDRPQASERRKRSWRSERQRRTRQSGRSERKRRTSSRRTHRCQASRRRTSQTVGRRHRTATNGAGSCLSRRPRVQNGHTLQLAARYIEWQKLHTSRVFVQVRKLVVARFRQFEGSGCRTMPSSSLVSVSSLSRG
jgi:hypothetical protein